MSVHAKEAKRSSTSSIKKTWDRDAIPSHAFAPSLPVALLGLVACFPYVAKLATSGEWSFLDKWDDDGNFLQNEMIQSMTINNMIDMWREVRINVYEPLSWILKASIVSSAGMSSFAVRAVSAAFHGANTMLLFDITSQILSRYSSTSAWTQMVGSFVGCALWGLHPLHVEIVGWPSAQPYALAAFFSLLSVRAYLDDRHIISALLYAAAVLSKSAAVFLPVALFCLDVVALPASRSDDGKTSRIDKVLGATMQLVKTWLTRRLHVWTCIIFIVLTMWANVRGAALDADTYMLTRSERIGKVLHVYSASVWRTMWPVHLRPHYRLHTAMLHLSSSSSLMIVVVATVVTITLARHWKDNVPVLATLVACVSALAPVSGIVNHGMVTIGADRYCYFPTMCAVPLFSAFLAPLLSIHDETARNDEVAAIQRTSKRRKKKTGSGVNVWTAWCRRSSIVLVALTYAVVTYRQCELWRNQRLFLSTSLELDDGDWRILDFQIETLLEEGRDEEAHALIDLCIHHAPKKGIKAQMNIAKLHMIRNNVTLVCETYVASYEEATKTGEFITAALHNNLGICALYASAYEQAGWHFRVGITIGSIEPSHMEILEGNLREFNKWDGRSEYKGGHRLIF